MGRLFRNVFLGICVVLWIAPLWLLLVNTIAPGDTYAEGSPQWWPEGFGLVGNLARAWTEAGIGAGFANSVLYAVVSSAIAVLIATMAGFAVVVMPVRRPVLWFWVIYSGTLFPLQMFLAPLFGMYAESDLYDTQLGLGLVYIALAIPFAFFVVRNQLTTIPAELTEAAQLDGASWWRIFASVHLPLMRTAMLAAFAFQFTWVWNDLLFGITLARSPEVTPVMAALASLSGNYGSVPTPVILAGALIVSIPTIVLFLAFQRSFARGIGASL